MTEFVRGNAFAGTYNFIGTYNGSCDGRKASLDIFSSPNGLSIVFFDLDRNVTFKAYVEIGIDTSMQSCLSNINFQGLDNPNISAFWPQLCIHTFDTNYLSGISKWDNNNYGLLFWRQGI
jgi:hypothetical protein